MTTTDTVEAFCAHCSRSVRDAWVARGLCKCGMLLSEKTVVYIDCPVSGGERT